MTLTSPLQQESLVRQTPLLGKERGFSASSEPGSLPSSLSLRATGIPTGKERDRPVGIPMGRVRSFVNTHDRPPRSGILVHDTAVHSVNNVPNHNR